MMMLFEKFKSEFPKMDRKLTLTHQRDTHRAFEVAPPRVAGYVAPTLSIESWPNGATVMLVEAAGAVGKSAAASELANDLNWPLVRAERAQVGSYSLAGLIQDATGYGSSYITELARGEAGVVVDSLDEAHFRSGSRNFVAFLENIWSVSGHPRQAGNQAPSVIMFSRSDTAELARLAFEADSIPLAHAVLDFFDYDGANRFIRTYMQQRFQETQRGEYNVPLASPGPFERLLNTRIQQVAGVLLQQADVDVRRRWASVKDFLGYTPVLIAIAESLAVKNPAKEARVLSAGDQGHLLKEIVEQILDREQDKLSKRLLPILQAALPATETLEVDPASIYQKGEQCARVLAFVGGDELVTPLPGLGVPESIRPQYEESVSTFLQDHPFIRARSFASVVFADYVYAVACQSLEIRAALGKPPETQIDSVGAFFSRFLGGAPCDEDVVVSEALVEPLLSSWNQESELLKDRKSSATVLVDEGEGFVWFRRAGERLDDATELEFRIENVTGVLEFLGGLKNVQISASSGIILGRNRGQMSLGPRVILQAPEVVVEAEVLRVEPDRNGDEGTLIAADEIIANSLGKVEAGSESLHVLCTNPPEALRKYVRTLVDRGIGVPYQSFLDLRTILTAFRPSTKGGLAVLADKMDKKILKSNVRRRTILEQLSVAGPVSRAGAFYKLDLTMLASLGFGLSDLELRSGKPNAPVLRFLAQCEVCVSQADQ